MKIAVVKLPQFGVIGDIESMWNEADFKVRFDDCRSHPIKSLPPRRVKCKNEQYSDKAVSHLYLNFVSCKCPLLSKMN